MKYLPNPLKLLKFWYPGSLVVFLRIWKNSLLFLEEDLAVGLMFRLLFVPLFHDATIVGRLLSFCFRIARILAGVLAMLGASLLILALAAYWFALPFLAFYLPAEFGMFSKILLFSGLVLFVNHLISHPPKKLWQIKKLDEIWRASFVGSKDTDFVKLLKSDGVGNLLLYLEKNKQDMARFANFPKGEDFLQKVWEIGKKLNVQYLQAEHFFAGYILSIPNISQELLKLDLKQEDFMDVLDFYQKRNNLWKMVFVWDEDFRVHHLRGVNRGWIGIPTPTLDGVSEDLTRRAAREKIDDFIGRQNIVASVINILSLEKGRNVVLVGDVGSGKKTLILYLAKLIVSGDAPEALATKRLVRLDFTKLLAGIRTQGDLAERLKNIFEEVVSSGNIVIYVPEIQNFGTGESESEFNLYSLMLPYIESSQTQFITTTESAGYLSTLEKNTVFARLFSKVELPPATVVETVDILKNRCINFERYRKIKISILAVKDIAALAAEYIHDRVLPDSALHILEEAITQVKDGWVIKSVVEGVVQNQSQVPVGEQGQEVKQELLNLENLIHKKMVDQEEAVNSVANTLRRSAANLTDKNRPIGSFLFVGPTGVGKTELAKILVETYFKGRGNFARFDMSEYQTVDAVDRLIGKAGEEGLLTQTVQMHPYSLILLDEFEKSDPKILNLFLAVLEDGRLTSGSGKTVDFTDSIIIATSNAASLTIAKSIEEGRTLKEIDGAVRNELLQIFKPELINRFDEVVLFKPLSKEDLQKIVRIKLSSLENNLREQGFLVEFDEGLIRVLVEKGFDPVLGARPLRRLIQDTLESKFSVLILEGKLPKGEKFVASAELLRT